ncbi:MAG: hypothetical protein FWE76_03850, partial [Symbiobacteriaceae bacterium]|nr:hypothetical protein [Symbiobacteriaceae bacterium]
MSILSKAKWVTVRRGVSSLLVALLIITQLSGIYFTPRASEAEGNGGSSEVNILKTVSGVAINDWSVENQQRLDAKDDLLFKLYEVGFDGNGKMIPVGDPIGSTKLDANGHIVFVNCLPSQWYAIVEVLENSAEAMFYQADPVYVYLGENGVMSSLKQANAQKDFTVQWSGNYAKGLKLVFSNGEFHVGSKPDGSGQNFTTERFDALMPDGSWIATYCADLGAHNIYGNYRFDENNHGFDEHEMLYLIAAFDFINDNVGGWYYTEELAGLQTVNGKAIAQIVLWNLILEVDTDDHGGYAKNWYEMIHPGANNGLSDDKKVKVAKIEGTDEWYLSMGEPTHEGGLREGLLFLGDVVTNDYTMAKDAEIKSIRELVDDILQNPKAYVALYKDKLDHPASGQEFVAGAAFIKGDDARYDPIDQQRQMLVLFGTAVVFDNRVKPSTDPIAIPIAKKTIGSTDSQDLFTFDAVQVTAIGSEIPVPEGRKGQATIKGEGSGAIEIGSLTPGVYFFMISEDKDATNHDEQWLYDDHCYWVQITVTDNLNNTATAAITGERGSPDFENYKQYVPGVTSVLIEGSKTVVIEGGSIYAGPPRTFAFSAVEVVEIGSEELITGGRSGTATVDSGEFAIGINALTDGIYYFMISEEAGPVGEGWEYADPWWIEVTVTDQGDSTATAIISRVVALADLEDESPPVRTKPEFVNTYTPETVDIEIRGTKTVESDDAYSEQEFTFSAVEVDAMGSHSEVISGFTGDDKIKIIGNGTFCIEITDLPPGVYYFRVSEVIDVAEKKAYWEYDDHAFWVEVVVTDDGKGNAEATLSRSGSADYVNFYEIPLTSITLTGTKEITGDFQGHFPRPFSFTAIEVDNMRSNNAVAAGRTGSVSIRAGEASIPFAITIDGLTVGAHIEPGDPNHDPNHDTYEDAVYYFRIEEDAYSGEGWLYNKDQSVYWIKVIVSFAFDDVSNQWLTKADIIAICDSSTVSTSLAEMPLIFTNHYEIEPASITLSGSKLITGKPSGDLPQFTFDLVQVNAMGSKTEIPDGISLFGQPLDETGRYNFSIADLGLGVYRFMITENIPETTPAYWTYDSHAYWVQVSVTDDGKGQAVATITSERDSRNFTNNYQYVPGVTSVVIPVSKQIEGVYAGEEPRFDFTAVQVASLNSNSLVPGGKSGTGFVTGSGEAFLTISGLTEGTYIFKINEVFTSSPKDGWTYDSHSYWIEIIVSDSGESTAIATPGRISGDKLFTNKYVSKSTAPVSFSGHKFIAFDFVASYPKETFTFDAVQVDGLPTLSRPIPGEIGVISADYQVAVSNVGDEYPGEYSYSITIPAGLETGDYYFRLSERIPAQVGNWKYDSHVYYIKIAVTDIEG